MPPFDCDLVLNLENVLAGKTTVTLDAGGGITLQLTALDCA